MTTNKNWLTVLGFLLAGTGLFALILSFIGIQLSFLAWIDYPGKLFGFVTRLLMIMVGIILIYLTQTKFEGSDYLNR